MTNKEIALNAGKHFLYTSVALGVTAALGHWLDPGVLDLFMQHHFNAAIAMLATPILKSGFVVAEKYVKNWAASQAEQM